MWRIETFLSFTLPDTQVELNFVWGDELYSTCEFVSLHIPATSETKNSINYELLSKLPKRALLINTARKEVINEAEIVKLMQDRRM